MIFVMSSAAYDRRPGGALGPKLFWLLFARTGMVDGPKGQRETESARAHGRVSVDNLREAAWMILLVPRSNSTSH